MKRLAWALLATLALEACAASHVLGALDGATGDAGTLSDGALAHDAAHDGAATHDAGGGGGGGVICGPNRCRTTEICCSAACGVCAFPGECVDFGCPGAR